jgi:hypothetical protein
MFASDELGLAASERPVLAFYFDKGDYTGRLLREDLKPFFQRDLKRRVHGFLDCFVHRGSIVGSFARGQFNANEGHRLVSYRMVRLLVGLLSASQPARGDIAQRTRRVLDQHSMRNGLGACCCFRRDLALILKPMRGCKTIRVLLA